ncbi:bacterial alpha-L-rhamnosidase-domain-containing protein [Chaetomium strumarium]|uniref:alpha-L-rhamnosidase n=1 Tax=Chaetomium strumarium TaxID=1170767 RepID=A0AAJ0GUD7_9PEZI|nr:bacterial alpha-L-rhamnosidase-domain-containing protein [Chaetomium strumarium]
MATVVDVHFEHYRTLNALGVHETKPRLSWRYITAPPGWKQQGYEVELSEEREEHTLSSTIAHTSPRNILIPWAFDTGLQSRQRISIRVRAWGEDGVSTDWSEPARLEVGLLNRADWICQRITAPWARSAVGAEAEHLYRKTFPVSTPVARARLYITAQGLYEAEVNGRRIGDYFLAPGWTAYDGRLQYQTYDITSALSSGTNCLGVRVAEGWFCGRIGFEGGHRNIWGPHPALLAQLEITYSDADGRTETICTDASWMVTRGPIRLAEIYDGEKYDATLEVPSWSSAGADTTSSTTSTTTWEPAQVLAPLPESVKLTSGFSEPVRRTETVQPVKKITSPLGKTLVDFGQNLVGYVRLKRIRGPRGHKITLSHAEVLENGELGTRPLRLCKAIDEYVLKGAEEEQYEPRFTFHGFRYTQVDGWPGDDLDLLASTEAVVCHTDMKSAGSFDCSEPLLNKLYQNVRWSMRGNFLSVPTDCPQRDERLGWTGDLALFAPTAVLVYDCFNILKNWLIDVDHDQGVLGGVPPMVSPNATLPDPVWCRRVPCAIWHDVTILAPWNLYQETGDLSILAQQYGSMLEWMRVLPRNKTGATHLWDPSPFQLGDWLDPAAPPDQPWKSATDAKMVANMFLIQSLDIISEISALLGRAPEATHFRTEAASARAEFHAEYVTPNGRIVSDTQAAYALAISLNILQQQQHPAQFARAGARLAELVRKNNFRIGTGFAGTPFLCEALAATGHLQVAYAALLETGCPSWLYPVTMGATTVWERWDSMLPDGRINPGEMTSFNHYAFGAVAKFLYERVAGLKRLEPGWTRCRVAPAVGAEFTRAAATHVTPQGTVSCEWNTVPVDENGGGEDKTEVMRLRVSAPYGTTVEVVLPVLGEGERWETVVGPGTWSFESTFRRNYEWPVLPLKPKS